MMTTSQSIERTPAALILREWSWLVVCVAIILLNGATVLFLIWLGIVRHGRDYAYFREGGPGTILSTFNLIACCALSIMLHRRLKRRGLGAFWLMLGVAFGVAAADDFFRLHESFSHAMSRLVGYSRHHPILRRLDDVLVAGYALAALFMAITRWRELLRFRKTLALWIIGSICFVAMITLDLLRWSYAIEDSFKIMSSAFVLCGLIAALADAEKQWPRSS